MTITKTRCLPQALLDETAVSAPVGASHEEELPGRESRPAARPWGRWPEAAPDSGWGSAPGRPGASRALRPDAVDTWPGAAASPQMGPRVLAARDPRGTGPQPPLHHAPCRPVGAKAWSSRCGLVGPSLTPRVPDATSGGSGWKRALGPEPPARRATASAHGARAGRRDRGGRVFTVTTSGTLLSAPRCPRSGRQSADRGRPLAIPRPGHPTTTAAPRRGPSVEHVGPGAGRMQETSLSCDPESPSTRRVGGALTHGDGARGLLSLRNVNEMPAAASSPRTAPRPRDGLSLTRLACRARLHSAEVRSAPDTGDHPAGTAEDPGHGRVFQLSLGPTERVAAVEPARQAHDRRRHQRNSWRGRQETQPASSISRRSRQISHVVNTSNQK